MRRRINGVNDAHILDGIWRTGVASAALVGVLWVLATPLAGFPALVQLAVTGIVGGVAFFAVAFLLGLDEARRVPMMILRKVRPS